MKRARYSDLKTLIAESKLIPRTEKQIYENAVVLKPLLHQILLQRLLFLTHFFAGLKDKMIPFSAFIIPYPRPRVVNRAGCSGSVLILKKF